MLKYFNSICIFALLFTLLLALCATPIWSQTPKITLKNDEINAVKNDAKQASIMARQFLAKGDYSTAKILLINAFNQDPRNLKSIQALYNFHKEHESHDQQAKLELTKLIENALYILKPNDVLIALDLLKTLTVKKSEMDQLLIEKDNKAELNQKAEVLIAFQLAEKGKAPNKVEVEQELNDQLSAVEQFLENHDHGVINEVLLQKLIQQRRLIQKQLRLLSLVKEVSKYTKLIESVQQGETQKEQARVMMLSNAINMIYSEDLSTLPKAIGNIVDKAITQARAVQEGRLEKQSRRAYETAKKIYDNYRIKYNKTNSEFQKLIDEGYQVLEKIRPILLQVTSTDHVKFTKELLSYTQEMIQNLVKKQQKAYNLWAAHLCLYALNEIDRTNSPFLDEDAIFIFNASDIKSIDVRYISPEVSNVYHQIVRKLIEVELPASKAIKLQKELMTANKKEMSEF